MIQVKSDMIFLKSGMIKVKSGMIHVKSGSAVGFGLSRWLGRSRTGSVRLVFRTWTWSKLHSGCKWIETRSDQSGPWTGAHQIINLFGDEYLRRPTAADLERLLAVGEYRGFPGMIGRIDCMHWEWKNCPTAWKGQYARSSGKPTIFLEAVASYDLWIWHAFFGPPGTLNDINVLDRSPIFDDIINGQAPQVNFSVNGREYHLAYYLTDGIYPNWVTFIQSIKYPQGPKSVLFAQRQEAVRKDVERAFGVLQARFAIIKNPALCWDKVKIEKIMGACIILHKMIVEDERDASTQFDSSDFQQGEDNESSHVDLNFSRKIPSNIANMMGVRFVIKKYINT
uniref:DDE Tnp4 domain-containing protein n=1 Tax=Brassica oleracea var. oleracea TaxID=109376 RepID=A0A0D3D7H8_BRAOL